MLELLLAVAMGVSLGAAAGLLPGLHPNTLIPLMVGAAAYFDPLAASVVLVTMGITNSFVAFIPAILLGAPEDSEAMSALPGHRLLMAGRGYEAIKLATIGGLGSVVLCISALPLLWFAFPVVYSASRPLLHWLLAALVSYMVLTERDWRSAGWAAATFLLSGMLGVISTGGFGSASLFPMLTGLFGLPMLLLSLKRGVRLPENFSYESETMDGRSRFGGIASGSAAGILVGLLPGIGSAQATVLAQEAVGRSAGSGTSDRTFLMAAGGVTAADAIYGLLALWMVGNPRSGISVAIGRLMQPSLDVLMVVIPALVAAAGIAAYLTLRLARGMVPLIRRIDYGRLNVVVAIVLVALVALFSGPLGLAILAVATAIGMIPNLTGVRRGSAMGCLLLPTILFFAGLTLS